MAAICVYCASSLDIDPGFVELAASVGTEIARRGHRLVSGGGRVSMMGAVAVAARAGGAHTTGVIPAHLMPLEVADVDADELVVVDTMRERKAEMDARSDAFLVLPGGIGTLEEFFEVWTAGSLGMHDKPVVVLDLHSFYLPMWNWVHRLNRAGFVRDAAISRVVRADDAVGALDAIEAALG